MAIIKSGAGASDFKQHASGGYGATLLGPDGKAVYKRPVAEVSIRVPNQRLTAAVAANSLIWGLRYNGANILRVKSGHLLAAFDGTAATSTSEFQIVRFTGANLTGGTALQPVKTDSTYALPTVDARFNYAAALGVAGVTVEAEFSAEWGCQRQVNGNASLLLASRQALYSSFLDLRNGEGLAIRLGVAAVIGDSLGGYFEMQEFLTTD